MNDRGSSKKPLGQILIEAGVISISQIEVALQEQKYNDLRIGEILVLHGWIKQQTVDFFAERWSKLREEPKKPIAYYLQEAGLLDAKQINAILRLQKFKQNKVRFHRLAVEQRYLKRITVDCFIAHIFNAQESSTTTLTKIYEILESYTKGEKNFPGIDLCKAPLMGVSFKGVQLDGSNLKKADLTRADLSHSSFVEVNLDRANLSKAVLTEVNFSKSKLPRANFRDANLIKANFQSAVLNNVDFRGANLTEANFAGANLTEAILPLHYPSEVYYDRHTHFNSDFDPQFMGWKIVEN